MFSLQSTTTTPYTDYEAQAADHLRRRGQLAEAKAARGNRSPAWQKVPALLAALRVRLVRKLQPAEEGYIA